ncbi:hypothetical protein IEN85_03680 [Pelagicoccus sp. NFK12]|uniref:Uncharacterized protein n=1 Tax=Pelagicoccus enzymogenes TaxID=2773457 RepID=A0A927F519_9BACT|nr:hypothetical protein [Pelagicoccus enzymogenes]MBD5778577.1 hypothetical protein [Pelagicoccus enzymogenes]
MFRPALVFLLLLTIFCPIGKAEDFPRLRALEGVKDVRYEKPFLCVIVGSLVDIPRIWIEVSDVERSGSDPDLKALGNAYNLRVYNHDSYESHLRDQSLVARASTVMDMKTLFRRSRFATVVELDWESEEPVRFRKRYSPKKALPDGEVLVEHDAAIDAMVERLRSSKMRPEKLLFMEYFSVGRLVFPVMDGQIRANGKKISYDSFSDALLSPL